MSQIYTSNSRLAFPAYLTILASSLMGSPPGLNEMSCVWQMRSIIWSLRIDIWANKFRYNLISNIRHTSHAVHQYNGRPTRQEIPPLLIKMSAPTASFVTHIQMVFWKERNNVVSVGYLIFGFRIVYHVGHVVTSRWTRKQICKVGTKSVPTVWAKFIRPTLVWHFRHISQY